MMSRKTLSLFLITACLAMPSSLRAQNVLLPSTNAAAAKPAATVLPAPASAAPTPTQATLPTLSSGTSSTGAMVGGQTMAPAVIYITQAQQIQMINAEKDSMAAAQQGIVSANQSLQELASQPAQTQQQRQAIQQQMDADRQQLAQYTAMNQQSQQRLQLLQAGPLRATDLMKMYQ